MCVFVYVHVCESVYNSECVCVFIREGAGFMPIQNPFCKISVIVHFLHFLQPALKFGSLVLTRESTHPAVTSMDIGQCGEFIAVHTIIILGQGTVPPAEY